MCLFLAPPVAHWAVSRELAVGAVSHGEAHEGPCIPQRGEPEGCNPQRIGRKEFRLGGRVMIV